MDLLLAAAIGALLFGGGTTVITEQGHAEEKPGNFVTPQIISINKKTHEVLMTCSECGGAGIKEYSHTSFSSSVPAENGTKVYRNTCRTCEGSKFLKVKIDDKLWKKAKRLSLTTK